MTFKFDQFVELSCMGRSQQLEVECDAAQAIDTVATFV